MAERAVIQIVAETEEARHELEQLGASLNEVDVEAVEAGDGFERLSSAAQRELAETRVQAERTAASMNQMGGSARGTAADLGFELTQAAQDAQFGMAGVANQVPLITQQFQRLSEQSGGTTGAIEELISTFTGPTGLLAAGTLAIQFIPQLIDLLSSTGDSAEKSAEQMKSLRDAVSEVVSVSSERQRDLELSLQAAGEAISTTERRIRALREIQDQLSATGLIQDFEELSPLAQNIARNLTEQSEGLSLSTDLVEQQLEDEKAIQEELEQQQTQLERQLRLQERVSELGAETADDAERSTSARQRELGVLRSMVRLARRFQESMSMIRTFGPSFLREQAQRVQGAGLGRPETARQFRSAQGTQRVPNTLRRATQRQARRLGRRFDLGGGTEEPTFAQKLTMSMSELQNQFDLSEEKARQFKNTAQSQFARVASAASSMGAALVSALQGGKKEAEDIAAILLQGVGGLLSAIPGVGQVAGPLLASAGQVVGSFQHGGTVDTPLQIVGERGPELAALPQGSRVSSEQETRRMLEEVSGGQQQGAVVQKLDEVASRVEALEVNLDPYDVTNRLNDIEQEKNEFTAT